MIPSTMQRCLRALALPLVLGAVLAAVPRVEADTRADGATITYRKVFKTSYPEFVEIKVNQSGSGTFHIRQLNDESSPRPMEIGAPLAQRIFDLAAKLQFEKFDVVISARHYERTTEWILISSDNNCPSSSSRRL